MMTSWVIRVLHWFTAESLLRRERSFWGLPAQISGGLLVAVGGGLLSQAISAIGEDDHKADTGNWLWPGLIVIFVGLWLAARSNALRTKKEELLREEADKLRNANIGKLHEFIDPLGKAHEALATLLGSDQSDSACDQYFADIADVAAEVFPASGIRACIYKFEAIETEDAAEDVAVLKLRIDRGRPDHARESFESTTPHGKAAIEAALKQTPWCVNDPASEGSRVDRPATAAWACFMQVPVIHGTHHFGTLSIDSRDRIEFSDEHRAIGSMLAELVAIGERVALAAGRDAKPEMDDARRALDKLGAQLQGRIWSDTQQWMLRGDTDRDDYTESQGGDEQ